MNTYPFAVFITRFVKRGQIVDDLHFLAAFSQYKHLKPICLRIKKFKRITNTTLR
jgi:hypothetical protein